MAHKRLIIIVKIFVGKRPRGAARDKIVVGIGLPQISKNNQLCVRAYFAIK